MKMRNGVACALQLGAGGIHIAVYLAKGEQWACQAPGQLLRLLFGLVSEKYHGGYV